VTVWLDGVAPSEKSGAGAKPQPDSLKVPTRVRQLKLPLEARYSLVSQNVQSSVGSTFRLE
jgi:hypothetical protein